MADVILPKYYLETIRSKECLLFIGSGISMWSGVPGWKGLIEKLIEFVEHRGKCDLNEKNEINKLISNDELLTAASLCKSLINEGDFSDFIHQEFTSKKYKPNLLHEIITNIGPNCFITTNYDNLIEDCFLKINPDKNIRVINNDQIVEQYSILGITTENFIFKPHGSAVDPKSIILAKEDYRRLQIQMHGTIDTLKMLLIQRPVVYLGFGLKDPTLILIQDYIAETYKGGTRQHFAIIGKHPTESIELQKRFWKEKYGINIITYDIVDNSHQNLLNVLESSKMDVSKKPVLDLGTGNRAKLYFSLSDNFEWSQNETESIIRYCNSIVYEFEKKKIHFYEIGGEFPNIQNSNYKSFRRYTRMDLNTVLDIIDKIVVIGPPGVGKSISLNKYATDLAKKIISNPEQINDLSIPIYLSLKEYNGNLLELIHSKLPPIDNQMLLNGNFTIIFDAINEAPQEFWENQIIQGDFKDFLKEYGSNKIIISTRADIVIDFIDYPIFNIKHLEYKIVKNELLNLGIEIEKIDFRSYNIIATPYFLSLLKENYPIHDSILNPSLLINKYLERLKENINLLGEKVNIIELFSPIAYQMVDNGQITIPSNHILDVLIESYQNNAKKIFSICIVNGFISIDTNSNISFSHQIILEYLASNYLYKKYKSGDTKILTSKIESIRWDETIGLFTSLLSKTEFTSFFNIIIKKDIIYTIKMCKNSTFENVELDSAIFSEFLNLISQQSPVDKLKIIGEYIKDVTPPNNYTDRLIEHLSDAYMGHYIASSLARGNFLSIVSEVIDLLFSVDTILLHRGYVNALMILNHDSIPKALLDKIKITKIYDLDIPLIEAFGEIFSHYSNSEIFNEIIRLAQSKDIFHRCIAASFTRNNANEPIKILVRKLIQDKNDTVKKIAISSFTTNTWDDNNSLNAYDIDIVNIAFQMLKDDQVCSDFLNYLKGVKNKLIIDRANKRINNTKNKIEQICLSFLLEEDNYDTFSTVITKILENYNPSYGSLLTSQMLVRYKYLDVLLPVFQKTKSIQLLELILEIDISTTSDFDHIIDINFSKSLFSYYQYKIANSYYYTANFRLASFLGKFCSKYLRTDWLQKINDTTYTFRIWLVPIIAEMEISSDELLPETKLWIIASMSNETLFGTHLALLCSKVISLDLLLPLLNSDNTSLRNNIYETIKQIQNRTGNRIL